MAHAKDEKDAHAKKTRVGIFGAAHPDTLFRTIDPMVLEHTSPAEVKREFGGVGLHLGNTLAKLGLHPIMFTVFGDDTVAGLMRRYFDQQGFECAGTMIPGSNTASYTAFHDSDGKLRAAVIVADIYNQLTVKMLSQHIAKMLETQTWVCDSAYTHEIYTYLASVARDNKKDVFAVISSLASADNLLPFLSGYDGLAGLFGNVDEINHLANNYDSTPEGIRRSLEILEDRGAKTVFATDGSKGVYAFVEGQHYFVKAHVVDKENVICDSGPGDAFAGAVIVSLLKGLTVQQAINAGLAVAALRLQAKEINEASIKRAIEENHHKTKAAKPRTLFTLRTS